jgi:hypothetical protein
MDPLPQQELSSVLSVTRYFRGTRYSGSFDSIVHVHPVSLIRIDVTPRLIIHSFTVTSQVVEDYLQSEEILIDTATPCMVSLLFYHWSVQWRAVTSAFTVHQEALNDRTTLFDTSGESIAIRTQKYYELTANDFLKGRKNHSGGRAYSSTMFEENKQNPLARQYTFLTIPDLVTQQLRVLLSELNGSWSNISAFLDYGNTTGRFPHWKFHIQLWVCFALIISGGQACYYSLAGSTLFCNLIHLTDVLGMTIKYSILNTAYLTFDWTNFLTHNRRPRVHVPDGIQDSRCYLPE